MAARSAPLLVSSLAAMLLAWGCADSDPGGPTAVVTVSVDEAVAVEDYQYLHVSFWPTEPEPQVEGRYRETRRLSGLVFPCEVILGGVFGSSDVRVWEVAAWLSDDEVVGLKPEPGDPQDLEFVDIGPCKSGCGSVLVEVEIWQ